MRTIDVKPINVEFVDKMGSDKRVCNAAKVSFGKWANESEPLTTEECGLLAYLATGLPKTERNNWEKMAKAHTHFTPYTHCFLSVRVEVPFFLARQLHKHVIGLTINEVSRRYVKDDVAIWLPDVVHKAPEHAKQGASNEEHVGYVLKEGKFGGSDYTARQLVNESSITAVENYYTLLDAGVAPEEARIVLPLNAMTQWIWSGSLLAFNRVYQLRKDSHAQNAAQEFAGLLGKILYEHFPKSMEALNFGETFDPHQK